MSRNSATITLMNKPLHQSISHHHISSPFPSENSTAETSSSTLPSYIPFTSTLSESSNTISASTSSIHTKTIFKRKPSLRADIVAGQNQVKPSSTQHKHVRWETPEIDNNAHSESSLASWDPKQHNGLLPVLERPQEWPHTTTCKPRIIALTTAHKPTYSNQTWNSITKVNLQHVLRRLFPDSAEVLSLPSFQDADSSPPTAEAQHPQLSVLYDCLPASDSPLSAPNHGTPPPMTHHHHAVPIGHSSGCSIIDGPTHHQSVPQANTLGAMGKPEFRILRERNGVKQPNPSYSSGAATAAYPVITSNEQYISTSQVAETTGGTATKPAGDLALEGTMGYTGESRKRKCENPDSFDRSPKVTRRIDDDGESLTQEVSNSNHAPPVKRSELHTSSFSQHHSLQRTPRHPLPSLNKFVVITWAGQLNSVAYLRDMGKFDAAVHTRLDETLAKIKRCQDHHFLTPKMLEESKLFLEVDKFVDQSPLANEICSHWRSTFGDKLGL